MSKAQTDIRTTSYDARTARPFGYQGNIDDVIAQIHAEPEVSAPVIRARTELLMFLGVHKVFSSGPSVEMDEGVRYGAPLSRYGAPLSYSEIISVMNRVALLDERQARVYLAARLGGNSAEVALQYAEHYPYPAPRG